MKKIPSASVGLLAFLHWNHQWNNWHFPPSLIPQALQQIKDLGVSMIRVDILWADIHRGPGKYDFSAYDTLINAIHHEKILMLAVLQYNKNYASEEGREIWNQPPDIDEFSHYAQSVVSRYKSKIRHWEIWNEPNMEMYWSGPKDGLKLYSKLLENTYQSIKKTDPRATVLNGGLTAPVSEDVQHLYQNTKGHYFDILNIHTFIDPLLPQGPAEFQKIMNEVKNIMNNAGDSKKKIWITEMGCPGIPLEKKGLKWFAGVCPTEEEQAQWIDTQYGFLENYPEIEKIFWAFYRDAEGMFDDGTDFMGLVRTNLEPKPAYLKLKKLIQKEGKS